MTTMFDRDLTSLSRPSNAAMKRDDPGNGGGQAVKQWVGGIPPAGQQRGPAERARGRGACANNRPITGVCPGGERVPLLACPTYATDRGTTHSLGLRPLYVMSPSTWADESWRWRRGAWGFSRGGGWAADGGGQQGERRPMADETSDGARAGGARGRRQRRPPRSQGSRRQSKQAAAAAKGRRAKGAGPGSRPPTLSP